MSKSDPIQASPAPSAGGVEDSLLSVRQAASYLGFHPNTVYDLLRAGRIPGAVRVGVTGRIWRIPATGLRAYLNAARA